MYDVAIIGAGLAGSLAAHLLAREGLHIAIIDPAALHKGEFRAEQIVGSQVETLRGLGLLDRIVGDRPCIPWARCYDSHGRLMPLVQAPHYGVSYAQMVNSLRLMPSNVCHILDAVTNIETAVEGSHQTLTLLGGQPVTTRLTVLATGLQRTLHRQLGERRERLSMHHSITWGFDVHLTQSLEEVAVIHGDTANQIDYLTLFPYEGGVTRGNLFTYGDPALFRASMQDPDGLHTLMPGLRGAIGPVRFASTPVMRSNHLWISHIAYPGVVMVGDAFQTPCPAAGTGITRLLSDVQALARHVPRWLQMDDVSVPRIEEYHADSLRAAADAKALHDARYRRAARTETSVGWRMHRWRVHQQGRLMSSLQLVVALLS